MLYAFFLTKVKHTTLSKRKNRQMLTSINTLDYSAASKQAAFAGERALGQNMFSDSLTKSFRYCY